MKHERNIAKITSTTLGYEDHGILTVYLHLDYGDGTAQGAGGYTLDSYDPDTKRRVGTTYGCEFIARIIRACGVNSWEKVAGRTIFALRDPGDTHWGPVRGIANLPTEPGETFIFAELAAEVGVSA